jgi:hypothetical protein
LKEILTGAVDGTELAVLLRVRFFQKSQRSREEEERKAREAEARRGNSLFHFCQ